LQHADAEDGGLARARLGLGDDVAAGDDRFNRALLDRTGPLEAVGVDAPGEVVSEAEGVEVLGGC